MQQASMIADHRDAVAERMTALFEESRNDIHRRALHVESDGIGRGATFTLELPLEAAQRQEAA